MYRLDALNPRVTLHFCVNICSVFSKEDQFKPVFPVLLSALVVLQVTLGQFWLIQCFSNVYIVYLNVTVIPYHPTW